MSNTIPTPTIRSTHTTLYVDYKETRGLCSFVNDAYYSKNWRQPKQNTLNTVKLYRRRWIEGNGTTIKGYFDSVVAASVNSYLRPYPSERPESYFSRWNNAQYVNLVKPVVDAYTEAVTSQIERSFDESELRYYMDDVGQQTSYDVFIKNCVQDAIMFGMVIAVVDTPSVINVPNLEVQRKEGIGPKLIRLNPNSIALLGLDRNKEVTELIWTDTPFYPGMDLVQGSITIRGLKKGDDGCFYSYVACGVLPANVGVGIEMAEHMGNFKVLQYTKLPTKKLPVATLIFQADTSQPYPLGNSLVLDCAEAGRSIYNLLSQINQIHFYQSTPMLIVAAKDGVFDGQEGEREVGIDNAFLYDSTGNPPQYIQPGSEAPKEMRDMVAFLINTAMRSAGLSVSVDSSAQQQSGESLRVRSREFDSKCRSLSQAMEKFEKKIFTLFNEYLGETEETWSLTYPRNFSLPDDTSELDNALKSLDLDYVKQNPALTKEIVTKILTIALGLSKERIAELLDGQNMQQPLAATLKVEDIQSQATAPDVTPTVAPDASTPESSVSDPSVQ